MLQHFATVESDHGPPELPAFVWLSMLKLPELSDFIGEGRRYETQFETPLDAASDRLRKELARILRARSHVWTTER